MRGMGGAERKGSESGPWCLVLGNDKTQGTEVTNARMQECNRRVQGFDSQRTEGRVCVEAVSQRRLMRFESFLRAGGTEYRD